MNIILTGAAGRLGTLLVKHFAGDDRHTVLALGRDGAALARLQADVGPRGRNITYGTNDEFLAERLSLPAGTEHTVIHLAFGRHSRGGAEIASSLVFMERLLTRLESLTGLRRIVYVSSQSVYGGTPEFRTAGKTPVAPELAYAMAKYAGEVLLSSFAARRPEVSAAVLRLEAVIQSQNLVPALCRAAVREHKLSIRGGGQQVSYLDAEDAAQAIAAASLTDEPGYRVYNTGPDRMRVTLSELAELVRRSAEGRGIPVQIETTPADIAQWAGMDAAAFQQAFHWRPQYGLPQMVDRTFAEVLEQITSSGEALT